MHLPSTSPPCPASVPVIGPFAFADAADAAPVPAIVGAYDRLDISERARVLGRLLSSVGPLGMAVVAGGAFSKYVTQSRLPEIQVAFEDAARATLRQFAELVRYVQQSDPESFMRLLTMLGRDSKTSAALEPA